MEANTRNLERIFDPTIQYQVPLFQRPYVWSREENLEPLWEDIQGLLSKSLRSSKVHPHFLGAVVFEQLANPTGSIETRQVIDGQQRLTTLQLFLIASRDKAAERGVAKYHQRFADMVANRASRIDTDSEACKLWPTNSDRLAYRTVFDAESPAALESQLRASPSLRQSKIVAAYSFFCSQLEQWLDGVLDDDDVELPKNAEERFETLWQISKSQLQLVVIDLDDQDETQVIFETLNARGEELLPADLIKNLLFRRAVAENADVERLYELHWKRFEVPFWREEVVQGRIVRPRIDVFINHYLTLMTREEVKSSHLFNAFKSYIASASTNNDPQSTASQPTTAQIVQLARYAQVFVQLLEPGQHAQLRNFVRCLDAVGTTTAYPFLLHAHAELIPGDEKTFDEVLRVLESFLVRRMICGLTSKNYNRLFVDLLRACDKAGGVSKTNVEVFLARATGDSVRFPDERELRAALTSLPLYGRLGQAKVRYVLEVLDAASYNRKSEKQPLPSGLSIEHVLPRSWEAHWPILSTGDPIKDQVAAERRNLLLNTIGNLTLITGSLNPALSNGPWTLKRPELLKYSKLNLNQYFHGTEANDWNEGAIESRTQELLKLLVPLWPNLDVRIEAEQPNSGEETPLAANGSGIPWDMRDRSLETKLHNLFQAHLHSWIKSLSGRKFEEKWHVGRAMLQWFLDQAMISRDEFSALQVKYSRPSRPGYDVEMYRIVWKDAGRTSAEVAAVCVAPHRDPISAAAAAAAANATIPTEGWLTNGVMFSTGTVLRCIYKGEAHTALVDVDALVYKGQKYRSPSAAAEAVTGSAVNGWRFWQCQLPGSAEWRLIDELRTGPKA